MNNPNIIFISYLSGACGNALSAFINGMIDPSFVSELHFSKHGNAHEAFDKRGNGILQLNTDINWLLPNDGKITIDASVINEKYLRSNLNKKYYTMRDHYDVEHLIKKIESGIFTGKIVYIYNDPNSDFADLIYFWFFKYVIDSYYDYNGGGEFWWRKLLTNASALHVVDKNEINNLHPDDCPVDLLKKIVDVHVQFSLENRKLFLKREQEHPLVLQISFRDIANGNPEILDKLSVFLDLPVPAGLVEKLALYASLQPSWEKYRKERGETI